MNFLFSNKNYQKTFKPHKHVPQNQTHLQQYAEATLENRPFFPAMRRNCLKKGSGDLSQAVKLPEGEDICEWVAVNTVDFFNQISMLYGTIQDYCTAENCPIMTAGPRYEYHWSDGSSKPVKCSAPDVHHSGTGSVNTTKVTQCYVVQQIRLNNYIDFLMTWVQEQLDDENLFPDKIGVPFPKNFMTTSKNILKKLFRVYAHIYHCHFQVIIDLGEEPHLNTSLKHFVYFVHEFNLIEGKQLAPLSELIDKLMSKDGK